MSVEKQTRNIPVAILRMSMWKRLLLSLLSSSSSDPPTESSQVASTSDEKAKPTPKQDDLGKKIETEKGILLGLCQKRESGMLLEMDSNELKKERQRRKN